MTRLVDKLNTLVRAGLRGTWGGDPDRRSQSRQPKPGQDTERTIATLREQINRALDSEDQMVEDLNAMQRQIADWDQQADAALQKGDEATARHAIRQMQVQQQRLTMLQADLEHHKITTAELISRVNELEAVVAENEQRTQQQDAPSARLQSVPQDMAPPASERTAAEQPVTPAILDDEQAIEDDLARRRKRLSL